MRVRYEVAEPGGHGGLPLVDNGFETGDRDLLPGVQVADQVLD